MKLITVATHSDFYFPILKESCIKNNLEFIVLGFGKKWQGFTWRVDLLKEYLSTLEPDEVVIISDAFDVIVLNSKNILEKFLKYETDILFSAEYIESYLASLINQKVFPQCRGHNLSVGVYMGKVKAILNFYKDFCNLFDCSDYHLDDQRAISQWCPSYIKLDTENKIFYNYNLTSTYSVKEVKGMSPKILTPRTEPCIVHGAGNANLHPIAELYGYDTSNIRQLSIIEAYSKRIPLYIKYFAYEIVGIIVIVVILISLTFSTSIRM